MTIPLIIFCKLLSKVSQVFNLGSGSTWPGHIALSVNKQFIEKMLKRSKTKVILIAGTNGKTTTTKLLQTIFEKNGKTVIQNPSGANLLNGIASGLIHASSYSGKLTQDIALFEVDENVLPLILKQITPTYLVLLNLFRDQLDRYGEVNTIAKNWKLCVEKLTSKTTLVLNVDDPQITFIGRDTSAHVLSFGVNERGETTTGENTADSSYCPNCGTKLEYLSIVFSHIGNWHCPHCHFTRPIPSLPKTSYYPLSGVYNKYNTLAAVLVAKNYGFSEKQITRALESFKPAFGRQEQIRMGNKNVQIFLSKNPTGFNESIKTIETLGARTVLLLLNDNTADGHDISWIWDIKTERLLQFAKYIITGGNRGYDMGLRIKYSFDSVKDPRRTLQTELDIAKAVKIALERTKHGETLYILPTYTAMLEARKILTGRKIL